MLFPAYIIENSLEDLFEDCIGIMDKSGCSTLFYLLQENVSNELLNSDFVLRLFRSEAHIVNKDGYTVLMVAVKQQSRYTNRIIAPENQRVLLQTAGR